MHYRTNLSLGHETLKLFKDIPSLHFVVQINLVSQWSNVVSGNLLFHSHAAIWMCDLYRDLFVPLCRLMFLLLIILTSMLTRSTLKNKFLISMQPMWLSKRLKKKKKKKTRQKKGQKEQKVNKSHYNTFISQNSLKWSDRAMDIRKAEKNKIKRQTQMYTMHV